jgi:hypothetical protein
MTAIIGGLWVAWTYVENQSAQAAKDAEARRKESEVRLLEAQKPFLNKKLEIYFQTANAAGKIINAKANGQEWNQLRNQLWSLRWSEMEMVGTPAIRERMRGVAEAMSIIHNKPEADPDEGEYHYLRWMVECLADELRASMEKSWQAEIAYVKSDLPSGCHAGFEEAPPPRFVPQEPGKEPPRTPARD